MILYSLVSYAKTVFTWFSLVLRTNERKKNKLTDTRPKTKQHLADYRRAIEINNNEADNKKT